MAAGSAELPRAVPGALPCGRRAAGLMLIEAARINKGSSHAGGRSSALEQQHQNRRSQALPVRVRCFQPGSCLCLSPSHQLLNVVTWQAIEKAKEKPGWGLPRSIWAKARCNFQSVIPFRTSRTGVWDGGLKLKTTASAATAVEDLANSTLKKGLSP